MTLVWILMSHALCIFESGIGTNPHHGLMLVGLSGMRLTLMLRHLSHLDHRPSDAPASFISPLSRSMGAVHRYDITIGGTGPYH